MPPLGHRSGLDSGSMEAHAAAESMVSMLVQYCSQSFFKEEFRYFLSNNILTQIRALWLKQGN